MKNSFDNIEKYKLYRSLYEIVHPTISKKNISNYRILLDPSILPVRIFYPMRISNMEKIIIYFPGPGEITNCNGMYSSICKMISTKLNVLVISLDYDDLVKDKYLDILNKSVDTCKYLIKEFKKLNISSDNIIFMGDSIGANMAISTRKLLVKSRMNIKKEVLFYPVVSGEYFSDEKDVFKNRLKEFYDSRLKYKKDRKDGLVFPMLNKGKEEVKRLFLVGKNDPLHDEVYNYATKEDIFVSIEFLDHSFLNDLDNLPNDKIFGEIDEFIK